MITAEALAILTNFDEQKLAQTLQSSGHKGTIKFKSSKFLGITNGNQFCYKVTYHPTATNEKEAIGKVFVSYNPITDKIIADY